MFNVIGIGFLSRNKKPSILTISQSSSYNFNEHLDIRVKFNFQHQTSCTYGNNHYFCCGELAEWSIAAVLKTVEPRGSGGSNPSLSAKTIKKLAERLAFLLEIYCVAMFGTEYPYRNYYVYDPSTGKITEMVKP